MAGGSQEVVPLGRSGDRADGKSILEGGTRFGYLHIVSDNLAEKYEYDLSNERARQVLDDRERLLNEIEVILGMFFDSWDCCTVDPSRADSVSQRCFS